MSESVHTENSGVLLLSKASGYTSHDCVAVVRRLYQTKKVGHTGTLDPMATGLLPMLIGGAVKAADVLTDAPKRYLATLRLGVETDTQDISGTVLRRFAGEYPAQERVRAVLQAFCGQIMQTPPMYSALKVNGEKLVDLARRGITVERQARPIYIYRLEAEPLQADLWSLDVTCSKGTYIRTLCADIGDKLGCGGTMETLCRTQTGGFSLENAVTLEQLEAMTEAQRAAQLMPVETLFASYPAVTLPAFYDRLAKNGCEIYLHKLRGDAKRLLPGAFVRLYDANGFWALAQVRLFTPKGKAIAPQPAIKVCKRFS